MKQQSDSSRAKKTKTTCNQEVFTDVAKELGLSLAIVKEIFNTHSLYTRRVMESNTFDGVRWPYLGVFKSKPKEVQVINHLRGLTPEQQEEFKQQVREGKYKFDKREGAKKRRQDQAEG
jgi:hypothetical protein